MANYGPDTNKAPTLTLTLTLNQLAPHPSPSQLCPEPTNSASAYFSMAALVLWSSSA